MPISELLPWRSFTLETSWPPDVVAAELGKRIGKKRWLGGTPEPFEGEWKSDREARFSRSRGYFTRDSFKPFVIVKIEPSHHNGSRLVVTMRPQIFVALFCAAWMTMATSGALALTFEAVEERSAEPLLLWIMPLFGVALWGGSFAYGARWITEKLRVMISTAPPPPAPVDTGVPFR